MFVGVEGSFVMFVDMCYCICLCLSFTCFFNDKKSLCGMHEVIFSIYIFCNICNVLWHVLCVFFSGLIKDMGLLNGLRILFWGVLGV